MEAIVYLLLLILIVVVAIIVGRKVLPGIMLAGVSAAKTSGGADKLEKMVNLAEGRTQGKSFDWIFEEYDPRPNGDPVHDALVSRWEAKRDLIIAARKVAAARKAVSSLDALRELSTSGIEDDVCQLLKQSFNLALELEKERLANLDVYPHNGNRDEIIAAIEEKNAALFGRIYNTKLATVLADKSVGRWCAAVSENCAVLSGTQLEQLLELDLCNSVAKLTAIASIARDYTEYKKWVKAAEQKIRESRVESLANQREYLKILGDVKTSVVERDMAIEPHTERMKNNRQDRSKYLCEKLDRVVADVNGIRASFINKLREIEQYFPSGNIRGVISYIELNSRILMNSINAVNCITALRGRLAIDISDIVWPQFKSAAKQLVTPMMPNAPNAISKAGGSDFNNSQVYTGGAPDDECLPYSDIRSKQDYIANISNLIGSHFQWMLEDKNQGNFNYSWPENSAKSALALYFDKSKSVDYINEFWTYETFEKFAGLEGATLIICVQTDHGMEYLVIGNGNKEIFLYNKGVRWYSVDENATKAGTFDVKDDRRVAKQHSDIKSFGDICKANPYACHLINDNALKAKYYREAILHTVKYSSIYANILKKYAELVYPNFIIADEHSFYNTCRAIHQLKELGQGLAEVTLYVLLQNLKLENYMPSKMIGNKLNELIDEYKKDILTVELSGFDVNIPIIKFPKTCIPELKKNQLSRLVEQKTIATILIANNINKDHMEPYLDVMDYLINGYYKEYAEFVNVAPGIFNNIVISDNDIHRNIIDMLSYNPPAGVGLDFYQKSMLTAFKFVHLFNGLALYDCGGAGDCGPNCVSVYLNTMNATYTREIHNSVVKLAKISKRGYIGDLEKLVDKVLTNHEVRQVLNVLSDNMNIKDSGAYVADVDLSMLVNLYGFNMIVYDCSLSYRVTKAGEFASNRDSILLYMGPACNHWQIFYQKGKLNNMRNGNAINVGYNINKLNDNAVTVFNDEISSNTGAGAYKSADPMFIALYKNFMKIKFELSNIIVPEHNEPQIMLKQKHGDTSSVSRDIANIVSLNTEDNIYEMIRLLNQYCYNLSILSDTTDDKNRSIIVYQFALDDIFVKAINKYNISDKTLSSYRTDYENYKNTSSEFYRSKHRYYQLLTKQFGHTPQDLDDIKLISTIYYQLPDLIYLPFSNLQINTTYIPDVKYSIVYSKSLTLYKEIYSKNKSGFLEAYILLLDNPTPQKFYTAIRCIAANFAANPREISDFIDNNTNIAKKYNTKSSGPLPVMIDNKMIIGNGTVKYIGSTSFDDIQPLRQYVKIVQGSDLAVLVANLSGDNMTHSLKDSKDFDSLYELFNIKGDQNADPPKIAPAYEDNVLKNIEKLDGLFSVAASSSAATSSAATSSAATSSAATSSAATSSAATSSAATSSAATSSAATSSAASSSAASSSAASSSAASSAATLYRELVNSNRNLASNYNKTDTDFGSAYRMLVADHSIYVDSLVMFKTIVLDKMMGVLDNDQYNNYNTQYNKFLNTLIIKIESAMETVKKNMNKNIAEDIRIFTDIDLSKLANSGDMNVALIQLKRIKANVESRGQTIDDVNNSVFSKTDHYNIKTFFPIKTDNDIDLASIDTKINTVEDNISKLKVTKKLSPTQVADKKIEEKIVELDAHNLPNKSDKNFYSAWKKRYNAALSVNIDDFKPNATPLVIDKLADKLDELKNVRLLYGIKLSNGKTIVEYLKVNFDDIKTLKEIDEIIPSLDEIIAKYNELAAVINTNKIEAEARRKVILLEDTKKILSEIHTYYSHINKPTDKASYNKYAEAMDKNDNTIKTLDSISSTDAYINTKIGEIRNLIDGLKKQDYLDDLKANGITIKKFVDDIDLENDFKTLKTDKDDLIFLVSGLTTDSDDKTVDASKDKLDDVENMISEVRSQLKEKKDTLEKFLIKYINLDTHYTDLGKVEDLIKDIENEIDDIETSYNENKGKYDAILAEIQKIDNGIAKRNKDFDVFKKASDDLNIKLANLFNTMTPIIKVNAKDAYKSLRDVRKEFEDLRNTTGAYVSLLPGSASKKDEDSIEDLKTNITNFEIKKHIDEIDDKIVEVLDSALYKSGKSVNDTIADLVKNIKKQGDDTTVGSLASEVKKLLDDCRVVTSDADFNKITTERVTVGNKVTTSTRTLMNLFKTITDNAKNDFADIESESYYDFRIPSKEVNDVIDKIQKLMNEADACIHGHTSKYGTKPDKRRAFIVGMRDELAKLGDALNSATTVEDGYKAYIAITKSDFVTNITAAQKNNAYTVLKVAGKSKKPIEDPTDKADYNNFVIELNKLGGDFTRLNGGPGVKLAEKDNAFSKIINDKVENAGGVPVYKTKIDLTNNLARELATLATAMKNLKDATTAAETDLKTSKLNDAKALYIPAKSTYDNCTALHGNIVTILGNIIVKYPEFKKWDLVVNQRYSGKKNKKLLATADKELFDILAKFVDIGNKIIKKKAAASASVVASAPVVASASVVASAPVVAFLPSIPTVQPQRETSQQQYQRFKILEEKLTRFVEESTYDYAAREREERREAKERQEKQERIERESNEKPIHFMDRVRLSDVQETQASRIMCENIYKHTGVAKFHKAQDTIKLIKEFLDAEGIPPGELLARCHAWSKKTGKHLIQKSDLDDLSNALLSYT